MPPSTASSPSRVHSTVGSRPSRLASVAVFSSSVGFVGCTPLPSGLAPIGRSRPRRLSLGIPARDTDSVTGVCAPSLPCGHGHGSPPPVDRELLPPPATRRRWPRAGGG